jgi:hypothetical protein
MQATDGRRDNYRRRGLECRPPELELYVRAIAIERHHDRQWQHRRPANLVKLRPGSGQDDARKHPRAHQRVIITGATYNAQSTGMLFD